MNILKNGIIAAMLCAAAMMVCSCSTDGGGSDGDSGEALFYDGRIVITADSSNPGSGWSGVTTKTYKFTAATIDKHGKGKDVTSLCGAYKWYIGGTIIEGEGGHIYAEETVAGVTVSPSADSRSCTVTVTKENFTKGRVQLNVVDWNTPQGTSYSKENGSANYQDDVQKYIKTPIIPDKRFAYGRNAHETLYISY